MDDVRDAYAAIGQLVSLGNLVDWMLMETCLAATDDEFEAVSGLATSRLLRKAKDAVRDDPHLSAQDSEAVRSVLAKVQTVMNDRGDAVHASYLVTPGIPDITRVRLKGGSSAPIVDRVSPDSLGELCDALFELILDLGAALAQVYPQRGARPGSTFAPVRARVV